MPAPIPEHTRAAILADIHIGELSRAIIARKHDVSRSTVTNIAQAANINDAFDRTQTKKATRARVADSAERRAALAADLLDDAQRLRDRAWSPYEYFERGADGPERVTLDLPPLAEVRQAYTALGIAVDKHAMLERHDSDSGAEAVRSMLGNLAERLGMSATGCPSDE